MRSLVFLASTLLLAATSMASASCKNGLPVSGVENIPSCDPKTAVCLDANEALGKFAKQFGEADKANPTRGAYLLLSSPWRLYDAQLRILPVRDLAQSSRKLMDENKGIKRIDLLASWTGVRPSSGVPSIAEQLSSELNGFPVSGSQGFLWLGAKGTTRTTRQAFTMQMGFDYRVADDGEVMVAGVIGTMIHFADALRREKDANGLLLVGVAWDSFGLCPEKALAAFEESAALGNAIAAYNAAVMRRERNTAQDSSRAVALMQRAADLGDARSREELDQRLAAKSVALSKIKPDGARQRPRSTNSRANVDARECLALEDPAKLHACAAQFR